MKALNGQRDGKSPFTDFRFLMSLQSPMNKDCAWDCTVSFMKETPFGTGLGRFHLSGWILVHIEKEVKLILELCFGGWVSPYSQCFKNCE